MNNPPPLEELKKLRKPLQNVNAKHTEKLSSMEKIAMGITQRVGTIGFFLLIFLWTISWLAWNTLGPESLRFDPFPAFVMWLFISNMIQIMLMPLIMIGQNLQGRHSETRAENDFEINLKAEREIEVILQHLENQNELILQILEELRKKREN